MTIRNQLVFLYGCMTACFFLSSILWWVSVVRAQDITIDVTVPAICGNGVQEGAEECDEADLNDQTCANEGFAGGGNLACQVDCTFDTNDCRVGGGGGGGGGGPQLPDPEPQPEPEPPVLPNPVCGDGIKEGAEGCDDGNLLDTDFCNSQCQPRVIVCGNALVEVDEQCDDGNVQNADGCSNQCRVEAPLAICGNGQIEAAEQCDDGNLQNADGCSNQCTIELPAPICGNRQIEQGEQCDDGNAQNADGCSDQCRVEIPVIPPQVIPPIINPPVDPIAGGENGDGGGGADRERITLGQVVFWIANGAFVVTPDEQQQLRTVQGDALIIGIHEHNIPQADVAQIIIRVGEKQFAFTYSATDGRYYVTVPVSSGVANATVSITYKEGMEDRISFRILGVPLGRIIDEEKNPLSQVRVSLINNETQQLVNVAVVGGTNPSVTVADGQYYFLVPNGRYSLRIEKEGFHIRNTLAFVVNDHIINQEYVLIKKQETILEALAGLDENAPITERATVLSQAIVNNVQEQSALITQQITERLALVNDVADDPQVEETVEIFVAPSVVGVSAAIIVPSLWSSIFPLLRYIFLQPLLLLGKRTRREWGIVYNSLTKLPLDLAVVRLIDAATGKVKQSRVTDTHGRYLFITEPGEYTVEVAKAGFTFPSQIIRHVRNDGKFVDVYHGETIRVASDNVTITPNVPLDPAGEVKTPKRVVWETRLRILQQTISVFGILLALISVYISPTVFTIGFLILHMAMYIGFRAWIQPKQPKGWGIVYNEINKEPVSGAVVRLFTKEYNKLVATQITDRKGRYAFLVGPSTYYVTSQKTGYDRVQTGEIAIDTNEEQSFLKEDVPMSQHPKE